MIIDDLSFTKDYEMIAIDLRKEQALDVDPKAIQWVNVTGNLDQNVRAIIIEEVNEFISDFFKELWDWCKFILVLYNIKIKWCNMKLHSLKDLIET